MASGTVLNQPPSSSCAEVIGANCRGLAGVSSGPTYSSEWSTSRIPAAESGRLLAAMLSVSRTQHSGCFQADLASCDQRMLACIAGHATLARRAEIIQSVPGCGPVTAACLCAELPELGTLARSAGNPPARPVTSACGPMARGTRSPSWPSCASSSACSLHCCAQTVAGKPSPPPVPRRLRHERTVRESRPARRNPSLQHRSG